MMAEVRKQIIQSLEDALGNIDTNIAEQIETPSNSSNGDFAFPCFTLAKIFKKNPQATAEDLANKLEKPKLISEIKTAGGYLNFYLNLPKITEITLKEINEKGANYGYTDISKGKFAIVEYSSPNLGKPMHVGHIRSTILGDVLSNLMKKTGYTVHRMNYLGDIGLHMGKLITAIQKWGNLEQIGKDPEKEMLDLYVKFGKEEKAQSPDTETNELGLPDEDDEDKTTDSEILQEAKYALKKLEANDPELLTLWKKIEDWSLIAFNRVYGLLDVEFDEVTGQSKFTKKGKEIVDSAVRKGLTSFGSNDAIIFDLEPYNLPDKVVLKGDGTALYSTQDLGTATYRFNKFNFDKSIYVVAHEQGTYFNQLFKMLELLGNDWAKNCEHFSFGMLYLEEGKMSSREGNVIFLEDVLKKSIDLAKKEVEKRNPNLPDKDKVAKMVGIGAMKYMILKIAPERDITFSWEKAMDFEGNSGPYVQYAYARACSILDKVENIPETIDTTQLKSIQEQNLIKLMYTFPSVIQKSANKYKLHLLAKYAYDLASTFNQFYRDVKVLTAETESEKNSRISLVKAYTTVMENTLSLLGIKAPKKM